MDCRRSPDGGRQPKGYVTSMLAPQRVALVERLLAEGRLSQRKIARLTGVSRATVGEIAAGRRRPVRQPARDLTDADELNRGVPARCPDCGGLVYLPCRLCRVRQVARREQERARRLRRFCAGRDEPVRPRVSPLERRPQPGGRAGF